MRRIFLIALTFLLLLTGCSRRKDITCQEIVAAYEAAGYSVSTERYDERLEYGRVGYIQANHPDGGYIYFSIFGTEEEAQAYIKQFYHPVMMGLFSVIYGDPSWPRWEAHGCIVVEYDRPVFYHVFENLMNSK